MKKGKDFLQLFLMVVLSCLSQVLSIYKTAVVAAAFGATTQMDAFNFVNNLTSFLLVFLSSGISIVIIPAYVKEQERKGINTFITVTYTIILALLTLMVLFARPIVLLLTNREALFNDTVCELIGILALSAAIQSVTYVTAAYYQCKEKFNIPKVLALICNIGVSIALTIVPNLTIHSYVWILFLSCMINSVIDLYIAVRMGFRYRPQFGVYSETYNSLMKSFFPVLFSTGVYRISLLVDSLISSNLGTGQLSVLSYASGISGMINSLIIGNLTIYYFPRIIQKINSKDAQPFFWNKTILMHSIVCLIIAGFACVGKEGITLFFERGVFTKELTLQVYYCVCIYVFGQQTNVVRDLIYRYYYAHGDTVTTFQNGIVVTIVNLTVSILLSKLIGLYGIVLGTIIASFVSLVCIMFRFWRKFGFGVNIRNVIIEYVKSLVAMVCASLLVLMLKDKLVITYLIPNILIFGILTILVYVLFLFVFRSKALKTRD